MTRNEAIARILQGLGFRTGLQDVIVSRLQEAQDELESGKTLPKFLLQEDAEFTVYEGTHEIALPVGFIREADDGYGERLRCNGFTIRLVDLMSAFARRPPSQPGPPKYYVIRSQTLDFINFMDQDYTMQWNYYRKATPLTSDIENEWLADAVGKWWLIGEAGMRVAADLYDAPAVAKFTTMAAKARASLLAEIIAGDDIPLVMGSSN
jgi:hypothetical protein